MRRPLIIATTVLASLPILAGAANAATTPTSTVTIKPPVVTVKPPVVVVPPFRPGPTPTPIPTCIRVSQPTPPPITWQPIGGATPTPGSPVTSGAIVCRL